MCWPSVVELVEASGIERRKVQRLLRELEDAGHVATERSRGRGNVNRYRLPEKATLRPPFTEGKATPGPPFVREKAVALAIKGDTATARNIPEQTNEEGSCAPAPATVSVKEPEVTNEAVRRVMGVYCDLYQKRTGSPPDIKPKDRKALRADLDRIGAARVEQALRLAFGPRCPPDIARFLARGPGPLYGALSSQLVLQRLLGCGGRWRLVVGERGRVVVAGDAAKPSSGTTGDEGRAGRGRQATVMGMIS